jgi:hypothetical protein
MIKEFIVLKQTKRGCSSTGRAHLQLFFFYSIINHRSKKKNNYKNNYTTKLNKIRDVAHLVER